MDSNTLEDKFAILREKDVILDKSILRYIQEAKKLDSPAVQINQALTTSWVGSPSAIKLANGIKLLLPEAPDENTYLSRSFESVIRRRFDKAPDDIQFSSTDPPAWLRNALDAPFYCDLLTKLSRVFPSNRVLAHAQKCSFLKQQEERLRQADRRTLAEKLLAPLSELARSNKDDFDKKLPGFLDEWVSTPAKYLTAQTVLKANEQQFYDLKLISNELETLAYRDSKKHAAMANFQKGIEGLTNEEFSSRLHQALSKESITSDVVIQMLWNTCLNSNSPTANLAARKPALMEKLVDYVFILNSPSASGLDSMKKKAIELMSWLRNTDIEGHPGDVGAFSDYTEALLKLYASLSLNFKKMLDELEPDNSCIFISHIIVKYIKKFVKESEYYESGMDPKTTPLLHIRLKQLSDRHPLLRPAVVHCLFECLKAPSSAARLLTTGKTIIFSILNHIIAFMRVGEEQLVITLFKENVSHMDDDALAHAIKTIFCHVKPPFSLSFVDWMCDWFLLVADSKRHLVFQTGIIEKFLQLSQLPTNLYNTTSYVALDSALIFKINRLVGLFGGK